MKIDNMKNRFLKLLFLGSFIILSPTLFAQHPGDDCMIYKRVLEYFNKEYGKPRYVYTGEGGVIDPVNPKQDSFLRTGDYRYSFFIANLRDRLGYPEAKYWFADLIKDSMLKQHSFAVSNDSFIKCSFPSTIKYQYKIYEEIEFEEKDYFTEVAGVDTIHYTPIRIFFSKVLYAKSIALVNARIYKGLGSGMDIATYSFVYRKEDNVWMLEKVTKATS